MDIEKIQKAREKGKQTQIPQPQFSYNEEKMYDIKQDFLDQLQKMVDNVEDEDIDECISAYVEENPEKDAYKEHFYVNFRCLFTQERYNHPIQVNRAVSINSDIFGSAKYDYPEMEVDIEILKSPLFVKHKSSFNDDAWGSLNYGRFKELVKRQIEDMFTKRILDYGADGECVCALDLLESSDSSFKLSFNVYIKLPK